MVTEQRLVKILQLRGRKGFLVWPTIEAPIRNYKK